MIKNTLLLFILSGWAITALATGKLSNVVGAAEANQVNGKQSQEKIDKLYEQKRSALQKMRIAQSEIDQLEVYNRQLKEIIGNQNTQISSLKDQINQVETTQQGIMPLMERMLNGLEQFISLDMPFLLDEREQRISALRSLLLAADVTVSEKFRRVLEAYQIELEYGRTIETYRDTNQQGVTVDILRIGRSALLSVTLDESHAQTWNAQSKQWEELDNGYIRSIKKGVSIAKKQAAPSLLELPIQQLGGIK